MPHEFVSVIMPTYNQASFISSAVNSLIHQSCPNWELIIVNDGSTDGTAGIVLGFLNDPRIRYYKNEMNQGLGASLNSGLRHARYPVIAYLPSDDIYYHDHLEMLLSALEKNHQPAMVYAEMKYNYRDTPMGSFWQNSAKIKAYEYQLVQVMHRKVTALWVERAELVTDDLNKMYWSKLLAQGPAISSNKLTCELVNHPHQRHKIITEIGEGGGGLYAYKQYYNVKGPIKFQSSVGNYIDEHSLYKNLGVGNPLEKSRKLKILIVGELSYNPERIIALENEGHQLFGLWLKSPFLHHAVGPFAFGHIEDIPQENAINRINELKPDIIYALLSHNVIPLANHVLNNCPAIPFVWHFKESPFYARQSGNWPGLIQLYTKAAGIIFNNQETQAWFSRYIPNCDQRSFVLDGELANEHWFNENRSDRLSEKDGEIHTVVPGRPLGLRPEDLHQLSRERIHLHFYGNVNHHVWRQWLVESKKIAGHFLHLHVNISQENWVKEFSKYDAGWLHYFESENNGELAKVNWNDLNYPVRMCTLAAAGLPMIQRNNSGHIVATQSATEEMGIGVFFKTFAELGHKLRNEKQMNQVRQTVWKERKRFTFNYHLQDLLRFFYSVIENSQVN